MSHASILIPTRNQRGPILILGSFVADAATDEFVVGVDRSVDGALEMSHTIRVDDGRIASVYIENRGADRARQVGMGRARGVILIPISGWRCACRARTVGLGRLQRLSQPQALTVTAAISGLSSLNAAPGGAGDLRAA